MKRYRVLKKSLAVLIPTVIIVLAVSVSGVEEYTLADNRRLYLLGEGRLVNLALGDGHPVEIMDMSFAVQALTLEHLLQTAPLKADLYSVPPELDDRIARMKLDSLGVTIDALTEQQQAYLGRTSS